MLSPQTLRVGPQPVALGGTGTGDLYEGPLDGSRVCVKRIRFSSEDGPKKVHFRRCHFSVYHS